MLPLNLRMDFYYLKVNGLQTAFLPHLLTLGKKLKTVIRKFCLCLLANFTNFFSPNQREFYHDNLMKNVLSALMKQNLRTFPFAISYVILRKYVIQIIRK